MTCAHTSGYCIFVDIEGAFNNLWWPSLFEELRKMRCPRDLYRCFQDYFRKRRVTYNDGKVNITRSLTKGCPQGSVCGPILWDISFEPVLRALLECEHISSHAAYADDIALIISAESRRELEFKGTEILRLLYQECNKIKLVISTN